MSENYKYAQKIIKMLNNNSYEAYIVGGYVRDLINNEVSNDIDICTNALPTDIERIFDKTISIGKEFGTIIVVMNKTKFEVTTYRLETMYSNNRKPLKVKFTKDIHKDLVRRDFTMNGLAMDLEGVIIDDFQGTEDIYNKIIKCIGNPEERFEEDSLRILRLFRFVSKLGFDVDKETLVAATKKAKLISNLSIERITNELKKIFVGKYRSRALCLMNECGINKYILDLKPGLECLANIDNVFSYIECFAICFIKTNGINDKWKFSTRETRILDQIIMLHEVTHNEKYDKLIVYSNQLEACLMANRISVALGATDKEEQIMEIDKSLIIRKTCDLKYKGQDIIDMCGMKDVSWISDIVDDIKYNVIMGNIANEYNVLKEHAEELIKKQNELLVK